MKFIFYGSLGYCIFVIFSWFMFPFSTFFTVTVVSLIALLVCAVKFYSLSLADIIKFLTSLTNTNQFTRDLFELINVCKGGWDLESTVRTCNGSTSTDMNFFRSSSKPHVSTQSASVNTSPELDTSVNSLYPRARKPLQRTDEDVRRYSLKARTPSPIAVDEPVHPLQSSSRFNQHQEQWTGSTPRNSFLPSSHPSSPRGYSSRAPALSVGQFPWVQLSQMSPKPSYSPNIVREIKPVKVRIAPPNSSTIGLSNLSAEEIQQQSSSHSDDSVKCVLQVLKEISRKRIHCPLEDEDESSQLNKKHKLTELYLSQLENSVNQAHSSELGKRLRDDTPSSSESDCSLARHTQPGKGIKLNLVGRCLENGNRTKRRVVSSPTSLTLSGKNNEILSSLSSSIGITPPHLKRKRKSRGGSSRSSTPGESDSSKNHKSNVISFRDDSDNDTHELSDGDEAPVLKKNKKSKDSKVQETIEEEPETIDDDDENHSKEFKNTQKDLPKVKPLRDVVSERIVTRPMVNALLKSAVAKFIISGEKDILQEIAEQSKPNASSDELDSSKNVSNGPTIGPLTTQVTESVKTTSVTTSPFTSSGLTLSQSSSEATKPAFQFGAPTPSTTSVSFVAPVSTPSMFQKPETPVQIVTTDTLKTISQKSPPTTSASVTTGLFTFGVNASTSLNSTLSPSTTVATSTIPLLTPSSSATETVKLPSLFSSPVQTSASTSVTSTFSASSTQPISTPTATTTSAPLSTPNLFSTTISSFSPAATTTTSSSLFGLLGQVSSASSLFTTAQSSSSVTPSTSTPLFSSAQTSAPSLFTSSTVTSTPFSAGSFNSPTTVSSTPATQTTSIFGAVKPIFGSTTTTTPVFGTKTETSSSFGAPKSDSPQTSAPLSGTSNTFASFGSTDTSKTTSPPLFGSTTAKNDSEASKPLFQFGNSQQNNNTSGGFGGFSSSSPKPGGFQFNLGSTSNTSFGSSTTNPPAFGSTTTANPPAFGSNATANPPAFGSTTSANPPAFGSNTTANPPAFGSTTTANPPAFGSTTTTSNPPAFGASTATSPPAFGASTTSANPPAFGASTTPIFGAAASTTSANPPAFSSSSGGSSSASAFGAPSSGTSNAPAFGSTGVTSPPAFGASSANAANPPAFGASGTTTSFGSSSGGFSFGPKPSTPATQTSTFGSSSTFGSTAQSSGFGSATNNTPTFGSTTPAFGSSFTSTQSPSTFAQSPPSQPSQEKPAAFVFGAGSSNNNSTLPKFGSTFGPNSEAPKPAFNFTAGSTGSAPAPAAAPVFQFGQSAQNSSASSAPFQFGASGAPAQPTQGAPTMFSMGSGSVAPRRATRDPRRKR